MVFFVCEGCNESLKKNQVDKHAMKCSGCWAVTCVDCSVTFPGNDYAAHTSCVSEAQKYEGSLYKGKKEKMTAQDKWKFVLDYALEHASEAPSTISSYVTAICQCSNVPRQQKKFNNFAKNSIRLHSPPLLEELWKFLEACREKCSDSPSATTAKTAPEEPPTTNNIVESTKSVKSDEEVDKEDKKKKKKKDKKNKKDKEDKGESAVVMKEETVTEKKKSKKKKSDGADGVLDTGVDSNNCVDVANEIPKKKKKKKRKLEQDGNDGAISVSKSSKKSKQ